MSEIIDLLQRGISLYEKLVGVTRDKTSGVFTLGEYDARQRIQTMDEALNLDPSGVTALLLLRYYTETEVDSRSFSWLELLRKPELASKLDLPREILAAVESQIVNDVSEHFQAQLTKALDRYEASEREDVRRLLAKPDSLAFLRRDALRSMERLSVHQFLDGNSDPDGTIPVYAKVVHQWWNINSMIEHLTRLPSGVSLNLIREPDGYTSYFAFAIRNGGRLFVLSDVEPEAHPLRSQMSRRPDRDLERRIARNWFPYELLNLEYSEDGRTLYFKEASECTSVAVRQLSTIPLQSIAEMAPETLVWTAMMFELILEKFWRQDYRAPELSYTGEMIRQEAALLTAAQTAGLLVPVYNGIGLTPITKEQIQSNKPDIIDALGKCPENQNHWMLDRYGSQCTEESLNLLAMPSDVFLLDNKEEPHVKAISSSEVAKLDYFKRKDAQESSMRLHQLRATSFGTKKKLDADRIWLARYNWATQIQAAANKEFSERKDEVLAWYHKRVEANLPNLMKVVGHQALWRRLDFGPAFGAHPQVPFGNCYSNEETKKTWFSIMKTMSREEYKAETWSLTGWWQGRAIPFNRNGEPPCAFTDAKASYMTTFYPVVAEDIAFLAGCRVDEIPDVLQHFDGYEHYTGNSILDRIDPAVSVLTNPWLKLELRIRIGMSKRGLKQAIAIKEGAITDTYWLERSDDEV